MTWRTVVLLSLVAAPAPLHAQLRPDVVDLSVGAGGGSARAAVAVFRHVDVAAGRARLAYGLRLTAYGGDALDFTNRGTTRGELAAKLPIDPAVYALNAAVAGELRVAGPLGVGFNLDLLGVAAGPTRTGASVEATPSRASVFQYGSTDRGSLNSEFYVSVTASRRVRVRAGLSHFVLGYRVTDQSAGGTTERYQRFETVPFLAVRLGL